MSLFSFVCAVKVMKVRDFRVHACLRARTWHLIGRFTQRTAGRRPFVQGIQGAAYGGNFKTDVGPSLSVVAVRASLQ